MVSGGLTCGVSFYQWLHGKWRLNQWGKFLSVVAWLVKVKPVGSVSISGCMVSGGLTCGVSFYQW